MTKAHPSTESDRVRRHTSALALKKIDRQIEQNIRHYSSQPIPVITQRIEELENEWSVERWIMTKASALAFSGTFLGLTVSRKWFALPLLVTGFLFQHAVQGWCPPLPVLRQLGIRTRSEIDREKFALKALRGDFKDLGAAAVEHSQRIERILVAARA